MTATAILPERGPADRLTATFWRRPRLLLVLLLTPPLLWLGVVYLGSLADSFCNPSTRSTNSPAW